MVIPAPLNRPYHPRALLIEGVVDRGVRRRSRVRRPTMSPRLERREAQGPSHGPARHGTPTPLLTWVPEARRAKPADRKAGEREPRKLPGASRRSNPSKEGKGKQDTGTPAARKTKAPGGGALASPPAV